MGYLSPIFLEAKFGARTRILRANFVAKPPDLLIWKYSLECSPNFRIGLPPSWCMIELFWEGGRVVTPSKPLPLTSNFCHYPPPVLRCFQEDPLMTPPPTTPLQASFTATPPHPPPLPPKNFDHTLAQVEIGGWLKNHVEVKPL